MPALNFQARFARAVELGLKRQTCRLRRKRPIKPGDTLHLYTGMRTKQCRRLCAARTCLEVVPLKIVLSAAISRDALWLRGQRVTDYWLMTAFAVFDGFKDWREMRDWLAKNHGANFDGVLIRWG